MLKQKTVYFREEDIPLWDAISNKAEWLHNALRPNKASQTTVLNAAVDLGIAIAKNPTLRVASRCKHGYDPMFCKFAKNGKACK